MQLSQALTNKYGSRIFRVDDSEDSESDNFGEWTLIPIDGEILEEQDGFFILRALRISESGDIAECFIDLTMPERISDHAYFVESGSVIRRNYYECDEEVICAVPIDGFGNYELFYSRINPEPGLSVLRRGLEVSERKIFIAEDLGYILRDEGRQEEAVQAFLLAVSQGPTSYFIYKEIAELYESIGQPELSAEYHARFSDHVKTAGKKPWWKFWRKY